MYSWRSACKSIDDTLAGCLGEADLAVEERLQGCKTMLDQRAKLADCRDDPGGRVGGRLGGRAVSVSPRSCGGMSVTSAWSCSALRSSCSGLNRVGGSGIP